MDGGIDGDAQVGLVSAVVNGKMKVAGISLSAGDGLGLESKQEILIESEEGAAALFFVLKT